MEKITYPVLYYQLHKNAILGLLLGTDYQLVGKDKASVKSGLHTYINQIYKKYNDYWIVNIQDPKLKMLEVPIRPTFREERGTYPMTYDLKIPFPCVYGENNQGYFECYLPLLNERFFYYEAKQFKPLATHFCKNALNRMTPEQLHRMMQFSVPDLDKIILKINTNRSFNYNWGDNNQPLTKVLNRLAEEYPYPKSIQKNNKSLPDVAWELEDFVQEVVEKLINQQSNVIIVGNSGVGKSAVLKQAFKRLSSQVRKGQLELSFWRIMSQRITASAKYLGEWQENCEQLVEELKQVNGILWVEDLIQLIRIGGQGAEDSVAAFLLTYLQQGVLQIIGEIKPQELESMRRLLPGFVEHFQLITIRELSEQQVQAVLQQFAEYAAKNLKISISDDTLSLIYRLLLRYFPYESFPGKAVNFLAKCISNAQLNRDKVINKAKVIDTFIAQTGLPELFLKDEMLLDQKDLAKHFNANIIGQDLAVEKMISVVKIFKAGLNNPYKPIQTMLFAGPTGVGKTASAKALADYFFGKGQKQSPLIRIDMSEFQHPGMIHRFIGSGKEVGKLVQLVREKPFSVLLLDEVEKADPSIFDALLTVLDEGMLVDAFGRITSFRNTIIIMTTNLGASNRQSIGFGNSSSDEAAYMSAISGFFRPEFVNRIDSLVFFNALLQKDIERITRIELSLLKKREGFVKRGLVLHFSDPLIQHIAQIGFDAKYGARPLQRAIEFTLVNPIANWLLEHPKIKHTDLYLDFDKELTIKKT
jgi:ATP-dependent Clp protease ATP-binding subunit ClpA